MDIVDTNLSPDNYLSSHDNEVLRRTHDEVHDMDFCALNMNGLHVVEHHMVALPVIQEEGREYYNYCYEVTYHPYTVYNNGKPFVEWAPGQMWDRLFSDLCDELDVHGCSGFRAFKANDEWERTDNEWILRVFYNDVQTWTNLMPAIIKTLKRYCNRINSRQLKLLQGSLYNGGYIT